MSRVPADALEDGESAPTVLYLRSFRDDFDPGRARSVTRVLPLASALQTKEERFAMMIRHIGSFIAIGRPDEHYPPTGALRKYLKTQRWTDKVAAEMQSAHLIVLRVGTSSQGFWSEVSMTGKTVRPERLLYWFPEASSETYEAFRHKAHGYLPCKLPETTRGVFFLYFDEYWCPRLVTTLSWWSCWWLLYPLFSVNELIAISKSKPLFDQNKLPDPTQAFVGGELLTTILGISAGVIAHVGIFYY